MLDVVELICRLAGASVVPEIRGEGSRTARSTASGSTRRKLRELTGWRPEVALEEGLRRTIDWYREHPRRGRAERGCDVAIPY